MKFTETRTLCIYRNPWQLAEYRWDRGSKLWRLHNASEAFTQQYQFPTCFTEQERTLLEIKYSED